MIDNSQNRSEYIIGVDEAGRGPLAGPLVVAALIGNKSLEKLGVRDSKKLSFKKREELYEILTIDFEHSIYVVPVAVIDEINIYQATKMGMQQVIQKLNPNMETLTIIDGNMKPLNGECIQAVVKADDKFAEVSAASIIAKVTRDRLMIDLHAQHPHYAWNENFGYATKKHYDALFAYGATKEHRYTFLSNFRLQQKQTTLL